MTIHDLDTPCLVVDLDRMEDNLKRLADYARKHGLNHRPHSKTHKSPVIAKLQLAQGCQGITCAKLGEAEVMVEHGIDDILIAYPIVGEIKARRLCELAKKAKMAVALDSVEAAEGISLEAARQGVAIDILCEINIGFNRVGVEGADQLITLAQKVNSMKGLRLRGIAFFAGGISWRPVDQPKPLHQLGEFMMDLRTRLRAKGLEDGWISGGTTATAYQSHFIQGLTEIRSGMYIFNDRNLLDFGVCTLDQCALHVLTTVVSTAVADHAVIDGGSKTFSSDRLLPAAPTEASTFGLVLDDPNIIFESMTEEHGCLNTAQAKTPLKIGRRIKVLPNHVCPTVNLHEKIYGVRGETVETVWDILCRAKLQ